MRLKNLSILVFVLLLLSGCGNSDVKDNFCGVHINYQYCKCAFHNEYCGNIGMSSGEAKDYVYNQYDEWKNKDLEKDSEDKEDEKDTEEDGECKYDSDCDPICEGDIAWKMGCNARKNICEKTFDTDCSSDVETFGGLDFSKVCSEGVCDRNEEMITTTRENLLREKKIWSDTLKETNSVRLELSQAMLDANKNCLNGLADMTNLAIIEFATRVGSILAGGIPDIASMTASTAFVAEGLLEESVKNLSGAAVDYAGFAVEKLKAYEQGPPKEEDKKLAPHEYQYFKDVQAESDTDLEIILQKSREVDAKLDQLP
jgi:hypothetical protein